MKAVSYLLSLYKTEDFERGHISDRFFFIIHEYDNRINAPPGLSDHIDEADVMIAETIHGDNGSADLKIPISIAYRRDGWR